MNTADIVRGTAPSVSGSIVKVCGYVEATSHMLPFLNIDRHNYRMRSALTADAAITIASQQVDSHNKREPVRVRGDHA